MGESQREEEQEGHPRLRDSGNSLRRWWNLEYGMAVWGGEGYSQSLAVCGKGFGFYSKNSDYLLKDFNRKRASCL